VRNQTPELAFAAAARSGKCVSGLLETCAYCISNL
jgi:hypothetical protein